MKFYIDGYDDGWGDGFKNGWMIWLPIGFILGCAVTRFLFYA